MGPRRLTSGWSSLEVLRWGVIGFVNELIKWRCVTCPGGTVESSFLSLKSDSDACWRKVLRQLNLGCLSRRTSLSNWYSSTFFPLLSRDYCGQVSDCCYSFAGRRNSALISDMTTPKKKTHFFPTKGPASPNFVVLLWLFSKFKTWRIILVSWAVFFFFLARAKLLSALLSYLQVVSLCLSTGCISCAATCIITYLHKAFMCTWMHECLHGGSALCCWLPAGGPLCLSVRVMFLPCSFIFDPSFFFGVLFWGFLLHSLSSHPLTYIQSFL